MQKAYSKRNWKNLPLQTTPLGESNLTPMDNAIDEIDDRVVTFDTTKANQSDLLTAFKSVSFNSSTGVFTFTKFNDTTVTVDTDIEKIAINFDYDDDPTSAHYQNLIITLDDGTVKYVDMSALLTQYEFTDSTTIHFTVTNGVVSANVINGSIAYAHLTPELQAQVNGAQGYSEESEAWAVGQKNGQDVPSTDPRYHNNAKYYAQQAEASLSNTVRSFNGRTGAVSPASGDYDMTDLGDVNLTSPTDGQGLRYNAQSGKWENGDAASAVSNLTDVDLTNLANGQILKYNSTAEKWENLDEKGHTIQNASGTAQTQRANMQFADSHVSDDSANGRTVVENVKSVASADYSSETEDGMYLIPDGEGAVIEPASDDKVEVTADGVKTYQTLLNEIYNDAKFDLTKLTNNSLIVIKPSSTTEILFHFERLESNKCAFTHHRINDTTEELVNTIWLDSSNSKYYASVNGTITDYSTSTGAKLSSGATITLYYGNKKATVDLQTTANRCWLSNGESVQDVLTMTSGTCDASRIPNRTSGSVKWVKYGKLVILIADGLYFSDQTSGLKTHSVTLSDLGAPAMDMPSSTRIQTVTSENGDVSGQIWLSPAGIDFRTTTASKGIYGQVMYFTA